MKSKLTKIEEYPNDFERNNLSQSLMPLQNFYTFSLVEFG